MNANTLIGLSLLYLTLNFLIIVFFVGASERDYYDGKMNDINSRYITVYCGSNVFNNSIVL